jgi:hypothetical protein
MSQRSTSPSSDRDPSRPDATASERDAGGADDAGSTGDAAIEEATDYLRSELDRKGRHASGPKRKAVEKGHRLIDKLEETLKSLTKR